MERPYIICHMMTSIDGRGGMKSVFDGLSMNREPFQLTLKSVETYKDDAVWLRYFLDREDG